MSTSGPKRLLDYDDGLRPLLRGALSAERSHKGPDEERMNRIAEKLAAGIAGAGAVATLDAASRGPHSLPKAASSAPGTGSAGKIGTTGLGPAGNVGASASASASASAGSAAGSTGASPAISTGGSWLGAKGAALLATVAAIGLGSYLYSRSDDGASASRDSRAPSALVTASRPLEVASNSLPADSNAANANANAREVATVAAEDLPSAPPVAQPSSRAVRDGARDKTAVGSEEIGLLARAHDALRSKPAESLALCTEHEQKFPSGNFAQEREAVAIEALVYLGRTHDAEQRYARFEQRYPSSSHKIHLQSLLPSTKP